MGDVVFVAAVVVFFAVALAYIRGCAAIAGDEPSAETPQQ